MVEIDAITRSVHVHWEDAFAACPTIHPGEQLDTAGLSAWVELWVDSWGERARRGTAKDRIEAAITVHCFSRHPTQLTELHGVVDAVRAALTQRLIPVRDYETAGTPVVGHLRMREPETHDLTRAGDDDLRGAFRHMVVVCRGVMEESAA